MNRKARSQVFSLISTLKWKMTATNSNTQVSRCESSDEIMAYADERLADKDWLKKYEEENKENKWLEKELWKRLDGTVEVKSW